MLVLGNLTVRLGGHTVLDRVSLNITQNKRVGLVGRNGAGKSTLINVVAGLLDADDGVVETPRNTRIGYVAQHAPGGTQTPVERVLAADQERTHLLNQEVALRNTPEIAEVHERLNAIDAHSAPARASSILAGLGFTQEQQQQELEVFSGGWRMRVALAAVLFSRPDLLLLDEPSNYLDLEAALWLEAFLRSYQGTFLVISHERTLLNSVTEQILHLEDGRATLYNGNYDSFEHQRRERLRQLESMRVREVRQRAHLQAYVDRWRYKAHTARQAQSRLKAIARLEPVAEAIADTSLTFDFPSPDRLRPPLVVLDSVDVGYNDDPSVLTDLNLRLDPEDRVAFVGRNGNGKTTLARLLSGRLQPRSGEIVASSRLRVGYFAQNEIDELDIEETPLQHMTRLMPTAPPRAVRAQLGRFGFSGDKVAVKAKNLSGGERARLALALVTRSAPHLLILDEPTNHLDVDARNALVQALNGFSGAVIVITHDRYLVELSADRLVRVADGTASEFDGNIDDYQNMVLSRRERRPEKRTPKQHGQSAKARKEERRIQALKRQENQSLRNAAKAAENDVNRLLATRRAIDHALFDPDTHNGPESHMTTGDLMKKRAAVEQELGRAEARWVDAVHALESADQST